jgi:hypothetical protein
MQSCSTDMCSTTSSPGHHHVTPISAGAAVLVATVALSAGAAVLIATVARVTGTAESMQPAAFRRLRSGGPLGSGVSAEVADAPPGASASCTHAAMRQPRRARGHTQRYLGSIRVQYSILSVDLQCAILQYHAICNLPVNGAGASHPPRIRRFTSTEPLRLSLARPSTVLNSNSTRTDTGSQNSSKTVYLPFNGIYRRKF